jgi:hypothetical protein
VSGVMKRRVDRKQRGLQSESPIPDDDSWPSGDVCADDELEIPAAPAQPGGGGGLNPIITGNSGNAACVSRFTI